MSAKVVSEYDRRRAIDMRALRLKSKTDSLEPGWGYQRSLADLIRDVVAPGVEDFRNDIDGPRDAVEDESAEWLCLHQTALELRAVSRALEAGQATTDEGHLAETFTPNDAAQLLAIVSRRMIAAAELSRRLRQADHGSPTDEEGES